MPLRLSFLVLLTLVAALAVGCGSGDSSSDPSSEPSQGPTHIAGVTHPKPSKATVRADASRDQQIGQDLAGYFLQTCPTPAQVRKYSKGAAPQVKSMLEGLAVLCGSVSYIDVLNGRISVQTSLEGGSASPGIGEAFCSEIQGSDVADFTDGHRLVDVSGRTIKTCEARTG